MLKDQKKLHRVIPDAAMIKTIYRNSLKKIPLVKNIVFLIKEKLLYLNGTYARFRMPTWDLLERKERGMKIAVICDRFTWDNIKNQFEVVYLNPSNWWNAMEEFKPDLLFCEATWDGLDKTWGNLVYRDTRLWKDNRGVLKDVLRYCKIANIPTVFWNKEDSPTSVITDYDFEGTALLFDHIFTTAIERIPEYETLGHKSVHLMMFGYSPELFSKRELPDNNTAVFFGSWYNDIPERCADMEAVFDMVLAEGLDLVIYDRASQSNDPNYKYPEKYMKYVRPAVPYQQVCDEMAKYRYVININSVKNSRTMFARRVFEAMACGRIVISNESIGMRELFPGRIWFAGEEFDYEKENSIIGQNYADVLKNFTFKIQITKALNNANILEP